MQNYKKNPTRASVGSKIPKNRDSILFRNDDVVGHCIEVEFLHCGAYAASFFTFFVMMLFCNSCRFYRYFHCTEDTTNAKDSKSTALARMNSPSSED